MGVCPTIGVETSLLGFQGLTKLGLFLFGLGVGAGLDSTAVIPCQVVTAGQVSEEQSNRFAIIGQVWQRGRGP